MTDLLFVEAVALVRATAVSIQHRVRGLDLGVPEELKHRLKSSAFLGQRGRLRLLVRRVRAGVAFHEAWPIARQVNDPDEMSGAAHPEDWEAPSRWDVIGLPPSDDPKDDVLERWWQNCRRHGGDKMFLGVQLDSGKLDLYCSDRRFSEAPEGTSRRLRALLDDGAHTRTLLDVLHDTHRDTPRERNSHLRARAPAAVDCSFVAWWHPATEDVPERLAIQFHLDAWGLVTGVLLMERNAVQDSDAIVATETEPSPLFRACLADAWFLSKRATSDYTLLLDQLIGQVIIGGTALARPSADASTDKGPLLVRPIHKAARVIDQLVRATAACVCAPTGRLVIRDGPDRMAVLASVGTREEGRCVAYREGARSISRHLSEVHRPVGQGPRSFNMAMALESVDDVRDAYQILTNKRVEGSPESPSERDLQNGFFVSEKLLAESLAPSLRNRETAASSAPPRPYGDALLGPWCYAEVKLDPLLFPWRKSSLTPRSDFVERFKLLEHESEHIDRSRGILKVQGRIPCKPLDIEGAPAPYSRVERRWLHLLGAQIGTVFHQTCRVELRRVAITIARLVAETYRRKGLGAALEQLRIAVDARGVMIAQPGRSGGVRDWARPDAHGVWNASVTSSASAAYRSSLLSMGVGAPLARVVATETEEVWQRDSSETDPPGNGMASFLYPVQGLEMIVAIIGLRPDFEEVDLGQEPRNAGQTPSELPRMLRPIIESVAVVFASVTPAAIQEFFAQATPDSRVPTPSHSAGEVETRLRDIWRRLVKARPAGAHQWLCDFAKRFPHVDNDAAKILDIAGNTVRNDAKKIKGIKNSTEGRLEWGDLAREGRTRTPEALIEEGLRLLEQGP